jgi:hypothetical protein
MFVSDWKIPFCLDQPQAQKMIKVQQLPVCLDRIHKKKQTNKFSNVMEEWKSNLELQNAKHHLCLIKTILRKQS